MSDLNRQFTSVGILILITGFIAFSICAAISINTAKAKKVVVPQQANSVCFNDDGTLSMWFDGHAVTVSTGVLTMESKGWTVKAERK
jgi:hypothetical protein